LFNFDQSTNTLETIEVDEIGKQDKK